MDQQSKKLGEAVLNYLCTGGNIRGLLFGPNYWEILIFNSPSAKVPFRNPVYVRLNTKWTVFPTRPSTFAYAEDIVPKSPSEEMQAIYQLKGALITGVELDQNQPHIIMTLEDGRVVFVHGFHEHFEMWEIGTRFEHKHHWTVTAIPGGNLAIWCPKDFAAKYK